LSSSDDESLYDLGDGVLDLCLTLDCLDSELDDDEDDEDDDDDEARSGLHTCGYNVMGLGGQGKHFFDIKIYSILNFSSCICRVA
jgi:hypothetical protein